MENYSGFELIFLKDLPSACETVKVNVVTVGLWKEYGPVLHIIHLDAAVIWVEVCFDND